MMMQLKLLYKKIMKLLIRIDRLKKNKNSVLENKIKILIYYIFCFIIIVNLIFIICSEIFDKYLFN